MLRHSLVLQHLSPSEVRIVTENKSFVKILPRLFNRAFGVKFDDVSESQSKTVLSVTDKKKLDKIFTAFGYERASVTALHVNYGILEEDASRQCFIRGAFLAGGSVTDPEKQYHLELVTDHYSVSRETYSLLLDMGFSPKETDRGGNYIIYFKSSEKIEEFLTTIGAPVSTMAIMTARISKGMNNEINRKVNCDTANVNKTVEASQMQIAAINRLKESGKFDDLPAKLRETAQIRLENPELNLSELAGLFDPPVTKSGLNHRFRKILTLASETER